ncbi:kinase-like domain-containing protein, partial [Mycena galopus ATCC 62051]
HPNILPFFGLSYLNQRLCLVSPWMEKGSIWKYISKESPNMDRRLSLVIGLEYLHRNSVVHGDLRAVNVLVTPSDRACIIDFGLASIGDIGFSQSRLTTGGAIRWLSPELLGSPKSGFHPIVHVLDYSLHFWQVLTGKLPFFEIHNDALVASQVLAGLRPSRLEACFETSMLENLWDLLQDCWKENPGERPTADQIVQKLVGPSVQATSTSSPS